METEVIVPQVGESITEVEIGAWLKAVGDRVAKDEPLVTIDSEKATLEVPAPVGGVLTRIYKTKGQVAKIGEAIALLSTEASASSSRTPQVQSQPKADTVVAATPSTTAERRVMPAAERLMHELKVSPNQVEGTGPGGRILKEDVLRVSSQQNKASSAATNLARETTSQAMSAGPVRDASGREEEVVPMSRLRRTVAERLVEAQHAAALLTTFNEIDMSAVMQLRKDYGEGFQQKYQVKLGFMSFFVRACVEALRLFPALNARVSGTDIIYHNYYDIGVAVGGGKGLVVPVLRNAERMSFAELEVTIGDLARRARDNKLKLEELQGGTFTISNGGVYGSLLSTPIINPPQSGVLGMHAIQERPVARDGAVVIRPMMYVALTYDHRIVDGREAVSFLKRVKDTIEDPARMLIEI